MEKRAFLAILLSVAVFYVYSLILPPEKKVAPSQPAPVANAVSIPAQQPQTANTVSGAPRATEAVIAVQRDITVDTDLYTAAFSTRGGALKSLTLKKYREQNTPNAHSVVLGITADPAILTFASRAPGFNLPEGSVFTSDATDIKVSGKEQKRIVFTYSNQGVTFRKIYSIAGNSYGIKLDCQIANNTSASLTGSLQEVLSYTSQSKAKESRYDASGSYLYSENSLKNDKAKDISSSSKIYDKNPQWAGFADKYFLTAIISENNSIASVELKKNASGYLESIASSPQMTVNAGQTATVSQRLFVGPKDIDLLKEQGNSLEQSLDLGWFSVIAKPLLYTLKFFYRYVGNYGVAIIIITVILKALFFPLTHKSYKSMKDMQKIQPMMAALKEKHKNDRDAMNRAVMELYRDHKVNPLGGCLPMLIQIPVFFALYKALMFSIELRHAPFFLWITDLSGPDNLFGQLLGLPFVIGPLPLVMGATMFIQQKMTPSNMDPAQAKMMLMLPVVFTFMFLNFPSGLVLYWLMNNILTISQQMYINKLVND